MRRFAAISLIFILTGCNNIPTVPEKSYQIARKEGLKVGYTVYPPPQRCDCPLAERIGTGTVENVCPGVARDINSCQPGTT